jgi:hypothetical protein
MWTWILLFLAAVLAAHVGLYILLRPETTVRKVIEMPAERRRA